MKEKVTIAALQQMKSHGQKIVGIVAWDFHMAQIADRAGVDVISVGDSVGINLWGHTTASEITLEEMLVVCKAVRRGTRRAIVNCDLPVAVQVGVEAAVHAAQRFFHEGGAEMVKIDRAAESPEMIDAIVRAGIPVFAEFEPAPGQLTEELVANAKRIEAAGASLIDFKHSGPVAGPAVAAAVSIPVVGGLGGGPWLDGRLRLAHGAIGYAASALESTTENYANVARIAFDALTAYASDVRAHRQIKGS